MTVGTSKFGAPQRVTASVQIKAQGGRLWFVVLEGGSDASSIDFKNALTDTGTILFGATAPFTSANASAQDTVVIDLTPVGGIDYDIGIFAVLTGTGAIAYVWSD